KYLTKSFILMMLAISAFAADAHTGQIRFGQVPLPGAVVRATQGERSVQTVSDIEGRYAFQELGTGAWTIQVEMPSFEVARREWIGGTDVAVVQWDLKMLPLDGMKEKLSAGFPNTPPTPTLQVSSPSDEAADRLLINGSVSNGASTPFALANAFGNNRRN